MKRNATALILLVCAMVAVGACRSRRKIPAPQSSPPAPTGTATATTPVATTESDFRAPAAEPEVLSSDLAELTRTAHARGWIRDPYFAFDASTLDAEAQDALQQSARWLRDNPAYSIRIEGHCDERGTEQYNLALGDRRAQAALDYLATLGVAQGRMNTISYGESQPFATGSDEDSWRQNRRAHLVVTSRAD